MKSWTPATAPRRVEAAILTADTHLVAPTDGRRELADDSGGQDCGTRLR
jgi:hypothetical protein